MAANQPPRPRGRPFAANPSSSFPEPTWIMCCSAPAIRKGCKLVRQLQRDSYRRWPTALRALLRSDEEGLFQSKQSTTSPVKRGSPRCNRLINLFKLKHKTRRPDKARRLKANKGINHESVSSPDSGERGGLWVGITDF